MSPEVENAQGAAPLPSLPGVDSSLAFLREGYGFVGRRCAELGTDGFHTRLMLHPVTCVRGADAARMFYEPGRMTRRGAMPATVVALLQDKGSVQALDGAAHRARKGMFIDLMSPDRLEAARGIFAAEWNAAARGWRGRTVALRDAVTEVMTRTALEWCGLAPDAQDVGARAEELSAMYLSAGKLGPGYLRARLLRARSESWAWGVIRAAREAPENSRHAIRALALHRDSDGGLMTEAEAAVELLNLLRPIVAVGRYVVFLAHALHVHEDAISRLAPEESEARRRAVAEEVRRLYPFFPMIGGRVLEAFDWRGERFGAGAWLLLDLYGTNRDPASWADPEAFRPERHLNGEAEPDAMIPQGGGDYSNGHRCPGEWLTVALLTEAVGQLLALDYGVPAQDLGLADNSFPPCPHDGMLISVAEGRAERSGALSG